MEENFLYHAGKLVSWFLPALFVAGGIVAGLIAEKVILPLFQRIANRTRWEGDDVVVKAFRWMGFIWFFMGGLYGASHYINWNPGLIHAIHEGLLVLSIFSATVVLTRIATGLVRLQTEKLNGVIPTTSIFLNLTRVFCYILGFLIILQSLGISITPILTALGVGGLAVALALQDTLANLFAGLQIIVTRKLIVGDYIKIENGEEGYVIDISWRYTTIRTLSNNVVVIPNMKLAGSVFTNYFSPVKELSISVSLGINYQNDLDKAEAIALEVATGVMKDLVGSEIQEAPSVRFSQFTETSVILGISLRITEFTQQYEVKHQLIKRLHRRFLEENIGMPVPRREITIKS